MTSSVDGIPSWPLNVVVLIIVGWFAYTVGHGRGVNAGYGDGVRSARDMNQRDAVALARLEERTRMPATALCTEISQSRVDGRALDLLIEAMGEDRFRRALIDSDYDWRLDAYPDAGTYGGRYRD